MRVMTPHNDAVELMFCSMGDGVECGREQK